jgi:hypothetical protein
MVWFHGMLWSGAKQRLTDIKMHQMYRFTLHLKVIQIRQLLTYVQSKTEKMARWLLLFVMSLHLVLQNKADVCWSVM